MIYLVICTVALLASALTFFSGFGLGTLLLPALIIFFPTEQAVALTAVVHFLNGLFKLGLVGKHAQMTIVLRFGIPAALASLAGAGALLWLAGMSPLVTYRAGGQLWEVTPIKLTIGILLFAFTSIEFLPRFRSLSFSPQYLPWGGFVSGFFGGLSGHQGALRSAFLVRAGLSKEAFIGTGVVVACLIDAARMGVYADAILAESARLHTGLLAASVLAAFAGAVAGNRFLRKVTMRGVQNLVAVMLFLVALGLVSGLL
jgi:uncharacterized protein